MVKVTFDTPEIAMTRFVKRDGYCSEHSLVEAIATLVAAYDVASNSTYKIREHLIEALKK